MNFTKLKSARVAPYMCLGTVTPVWAALIGLYIAQAIPLYLVAAALPPILRAKGVDLSVIGGLGILMLPWVLKAIWAPWIDRLAHFTVGRCRIGRKGVIIASQLVVVALILQLSQMDPVADVKQFFPLLMLMSIASATQDIATDGYAVEHLPPVAQSGGNAIQSGAVAAGVLIGGTGTLLLYDQIGWQNSLTIVAALSALAVSLFILIPEALGKRPTELYAPRASLRAFFQRPQALAILGFALIFRLPEGLIKALEQSFLVDQGASLSLIGLVSGSTAACVGLGGAFIGMVIIRHYGLTQFFIGFVLARVFIFAGYAIAAFVGAPIWVVIALSAANTFSRYMEIVGLYTAFMRVASLSQAGTDFTILSSANLFVYMIGSMVAGFMAQAFGYAWVFIIACGLACITGVFALRLLSKTHLTLQN